MSRYKETKMPKKTSKKKITKKTVAKKPKRTKKPKLHKLMSKTRKFITEHVVNSPKDIVAEVAANTKIGHEGAPPVKKVTKPNNNFPLWPDAKCGECSHDASNDPNGECYLYKLECPGCGKEGCDECMPSGRGCVCPECEGKARGEEPEVGDADIAEEVGEDTEELDDIGADDPDDEEVA